MGGSREVKGPGKSTQASQNLYTHAHNTHTQGQKQRYKKCCTGHKKEALGGMMAMWVDVGRLG